MSHETHHKLDDISQSILKLRDVGDTVFDELHAKISKLLILVEIQKKLNEIARAIREGNALPVRRINYNIKKLSENDEACQIRWSALRELTCSAIVFSTMAFNGLISLPDKQYECLVENVQKYIEVQELPCDWIARDQIRRVVAGTPRREGTQPFLQDYHNLEIQLSQDISSNVKKGSARKRRRLEAGEHSLSPNQEPALELVAQTPVGQGAAPAGVETTILRVIRFEKHTLQQIVLERPTDILGGIWFGSPPGFVPFVSLRLSRLLGDIIKPSGQEVHMPEPAPDASRTFTGVYSIELECFRQLIQRDGFGAIFWNEYGGEAFVAMQVMDKDLIADFIQASQAAISVLPMLDTVSTGNSA